MFSSEDRLVTSRIAWAAALVLVLTTVWVVDSRTASADSPPGDGIAVVLIAVANNFPDSLGAGPAAARYGAPIILVPTDPPIPGVTELELLRLDPREVVIIGGTGVVSEEMEAALGSLLPNSAVSRIAGSNRYETNTLVSEVFFPVEGWVSVGPEAFTTFSPATDGTAIYGNAVWSDAPLVAPIHLPDGAQILELRAGVKDSNAADIRVQLTYLTTEGSQGVIAQTLSTGTPGDTTLSSTTIGEYDPTSRFVDNSTRSYAVSMGESSGVGSLSSSLFGRVVMVKYRIGAGGPPEA